MREVWKSVWYECGGCKEVGESMLGCGEEWRIVWEDVGKNVGSQHTLLYLSHTLHTHPTPFPHPPQSLNTAPPLPPHSPDTSLHTFPHSPHTYPHSLTLPHTHLTPSPHLLHHFPTLTPHISSQPPHLLQHFPILPRVPMLYHLPHIKISHFSHLLPN